MLKPPTLRRPLVLASVMAAMFVIAIEATIVATAMPQIAAELGDLHLYSWVFAAFLLTQTATTVLFGKLADLYGRRPVLFVGIGVFLVGSLLCGFAWSMPALIAFRLVQGVGAGAIQPIAMTVVGDLYTMEERGRIQGYLASVWGVSSVLGPLVGGVIIQHMDWGWIFWLNIPIALLAAAGFYAFLHEAVEARERHVDTPGAVLFAITVAALMIAVTELGKSDLTIAGTAASVAVGGAALFVWQETRARDPMMVFQLWAHRPIAAANATALLAGMALIGLTTFLPMYVQGVLGRTPLEAGFALTMMVLGWPIGATTAARNFTRFGLRPILLFGAGLLPVGAIAFVVLGPDSSPLLAGGGSLVMGLGMGLLNSTAIVMIQSSVGWSERASATASNIFSRNLGSTLGATMLGGVLNVSLARGTGVNFDQIRTLLDHAQAGLSDAGVRAALALGLHQTFLCVFVIALLALACATLVPAAVTGRSD